MMFRRTSNKDGDISASAKLELRHQRTGDVVFDWKGKVVPNSILRPCEPLRQASVLHLQADRNSPSKGDDRFEEGVEPEDG